MELKDYIFILRKRFLWFLTLLALTLIVFYIVYILQHKYYSYEVRLFYQPKITSLPLQVIVKGNIDIHFTKEPNYWILLMKKEEFINDLVSIYNYLMSGEVQVIDLKKADRKILLDMLNKAKKKSIIDPEREEIVTIIHNSVKTYITSDNKFLVIECMSTSRDVANLLAKAVASTYLIYGYNEAIGGIEGLKKYYLDSINSLNAEMSKFQGVKESDSRLQSEYDVAQTLINELHSQILKLHTDRISYKEKIREVSDYLLKPNIQEELNEPYKSARTLQLEKELFDTKVKLNNLKMSITPDHPEYKKLVNIVKILTENIIEERKKDLISYLKNLQNLLKENEIKIDSLSSQKRHLEDKISRLKLEYDKIAEVKNKQRGLEEQLRIFQAEISRMDAILTQIPNYFTFYMASVPEEAVSKKPVSRYLFLWLLFGIISGIVGAYARESIDTNIKSEYDIKKYLNLDVLGIVPKVKNIEDIFKEYEKHKDIEEKSFIQELFMGMASIMDEKCHTTDKKIVVITSSVKYEGKSVCAYSISHAFALLNKKVLLIDGDVRSPVIHKFCGVENKVGLFNLQTEDITNITIKINKNLDFIPAGTSDNSPVEYLAKGSTRDILNGLKSRYDYIVIDSPPLINVSDSLVFSRMADAVVLIIASDEISRNIAKWSKHLLEGVNVEILGVILNKAFGGATVSYYYGYKYYKYPTTKSV